MSKIICDVCGTRYPDTADQCPICGRIRVTDGNTAADTFETEEIQISERPKVRGGRFSKSNVRKRNKEMPRYEMEEPKSRLMANEDIEEEYDELEPREKSNVVVNILLVIVILALLAVTGYIFMEYLLPNVLPEDETTPSTEATVIVTEATEETEEPTVPCTGLVLDEAVVLLEREGQEWLANVTVLPEDTTDELLFSSSDENVVMIDGDGKVTAVGEGDATITITCGTQQVNCTVAVVFENEETEAAEDPTDSEADPTEDVPAETTDGATEAPEEDPTEATTEALKNVTLSLKQSDVTFRSGGQQATFKLTCDLKPTEVKWSSENENVCTVDENGVVTRTGKGTTNVVVKYGDQEVKVIVRCP